MQFKFKYYFSYEIFFVLCYRINETMICSTCGKVFP